MSFLKELARRHVFRIGIAYLVVAWLVLQIVNNLIPLLGVPVWVGKAILLVLIAGFPVSLVIAWAFEVTPEGLKRTRDTGETGPSPTSPGRWLEFAVLAILVLAVGWLYYRSEFPSHEAIRQTAAGPAAPASSSVLRKSVAVLPFENLSPNPDDAYFAAGIHEEILNQLAKIKDLSVIARTSVMQYENTKKTIGEIAKELNVGTVVEGSVRYDATKHVRVTAQFIDAATGAHLWSEDYDRSLNDIFGIQTDIATRIADALEAQLSGAERENIEKIPTKSPEAYALYLKAGSAAPNAAAITQVQDLLDQAIALDPTFALAYARKALNYAVSIGTIPENMPADPAARSRFVTLAKENAEKALALDPANGMAYNALGSIDEYNRNWDEARVAIKRAVELNPNEPTSLVSYGSFLVSYDGYTDEGLRLIRRAVALDPNMAAWHMTLGAFLLMTGDLTGAKASLQRAIEIAPTFMAAYEQLAITAAAMGDTETARRAARTLEGIWRNDPRPITAPAVIDAFHVAGLDEDARRAFGDFQNLAKHSQVSALTWFLAYLGMGDKDKALDWLETAIGTHDTYGNYPLRMARRNSFNALLWDDPRFQKARKDLGFK